MNHNEDKGQNPKQLLDQAGLKVTDHSDSAYQQAYLCIATVLDSLDALVYVSDMDTYELLFFNEYGKQVWGDPKNKTCYKVLQKDQQEPCKFCTNNRLVDENGEPTGVYVWEFQNTVTNRWFQCRDQAIRWIDGRLVRMEIATDITERKNAEQALQQSKELAEKRADTDELTHINNRHSFFKMGRHAFKQARRCDHPISIVMLDIDYFKEVNDIYGHNAGDAVLKEFAQCLLEAVRDVDILGRLGGEEFAIILYEIDIEEAQMITERIRAAVENMSIKHNDNIIQITSSFGIASCETEDHDLEALLSNADKALYSAKRNGRNCIALAEPVKELNFETD